MVSKIRTGLVFLKEELIKEHVKNLEFKEGVHFVEFPRLATEEEQKEYNVLGKELSVGWAAYVYSWRWQMKKEMNEVSRRNGGVFQSI